jgi:DNA polymerase family A
MDVSFYFKNIMQPAHITLEAARRIGMPVHEERAKAQMIAWETELVALEKYVEGEAQKRGFAIRYSPAHAPLPDATFRDFLFSPRGLGLESSRKTPTGKDARDDEALLDYAAVGPNRNKMNGRPHEDHPVVSAIVQISSIKTARGTHLTGLLKWRRSDGCVHPKFNWNSPNTTRPSAEEPPVHQIPERANPEVAKKVKQCIVPRVSPWLGPPEEWDPRRHGWIAKVDVKGAEFVIRAGCIAREPNLVEYLQAGKDGHARTAALFTGKPEEAFKRGKPDRWYRDDVAKTANFLLIYGGEWRALQGQLWKEARTWLEEKEVQRLRARFFAAPDGYAGLAARYEEDSWELWRRGFLEDDFGRRWAMPFPEGVTCSRDGDGVCRFSFPRGKSKDEARVVHRAIEYRRHCAANRRTQADNATILLWTIALCHHGEYPGAELRLPPSWEHLGVPFPEAKTWQLNEGDGPGGKPLRAWLFNEVHDSEWLDGEGGTLEPALKVVVRRSLGVPADILISGDMLRRVECSVGPDLGHLRDYSSDVAPAFGLEPMPSW